MTADAPAEHTPDPAAAPPARSEEPRRAGRIEGWSIAWMLLAMAVWGWFLFLMLADYGPEYGGRPECRGPLVGPLSEDRSCRDALREWPALLGILALASIATVVAAATTVYAKVLSRLEGRDWTSGRP
ncbi:hypothetical protein AW27_016145 [Streptomyces sp. PCS3-D2]|uniref:hypothetical protein n=1 Tax=Streptomyces sp. PCS3-D2 TaxID=1460244 RepID=UPI0004502899|nr:hypothetical protein [Streptomyces sp. PCS3-D2]WKV72934.1 hypothetical protein AW27_016145 [Streptomyces sp. PCS3-D2]